MIMKTFHLCLNIEGALKQRSLEIIEDDNGNILSTKTAKKILKEEQAKGKKYFTGCDNVDVDGKCLGHEQYD